MRLSRTHEWSLDGRGPFKMPLSVMEIPQDDGRNALVNQTSQPQNHEIVRLRLRNIEIW